MRPRPQASSEPQFPFLQKCELLLPMLGVQCEHVAGALSVALTGTTAEDSPLVTMVNTVLMSLS